MNSCIEMLGLEGEKMQRTHLVQSYQLYNSAVDNHSLTHDFNNHSSRTIFLKL